MRRDMGILTALVAALVLAGCDQMGFPPGRSAPPAGNPQGQDAAYLGKSIVNAEGSRTDASAVDSALAMSEKNARLTEDLMRAQEQKHQLEEANRQLREQVAKLQQDFDGAQKELGEANQMLIEMRRELEVWKASVLGFRDEIRNAEQAQMEALRKVLVLLGAELPRATTQPTTLPSVEAAAGTETASRELP